MAIYIHYGSANFDPSYFAAVTNRDTPWVKPLGGLWASPVSTEYGWRDWCEGEDWAERLGVSHFRFLITPAARVLHLYTSKDLDLMPQRNDCFDSGYFYPDFEQMVKDGWDAIELHLSSTDKNWEYHDGLYWRLYGWDCDSILIMNPKIIYPLAHI